MLRQNIHHSTEIPRNSHVNQNVQGGVSGPEEHVTHEELTQITGASQDPAGVYGFGLET